MAAYKLYVAVFNRLEAAQNLLALWATNMLPSSTAYLALDVQLSKNCPKY